MLIEEKQGERTIYFTDTVINTDIDEPIKVYQDFMTNPDCPGDYKLFFEYAKANHLHVTYKNFIPPINKSEYNQH